MQSIVPQQQQQPTTATIFTDPLPLIVKLPSARPTGCPQSVIHFTLRLSLEPVRVSCNLSLVLCISPRCWS